MIVSILGAMWFVVCTEGALTYPIKFPGDPKPDKPKGLSYPILFPNDQKAAPQPQAQPPQFGMYYPYVYAAVPYAVPYAYPYGFNPIYTF